MQCEHGCHQTLYPTLKMAEEMAKEEKDGKVPSDMVPYCPRCGAPMRVHMIGPNFVPPSDCEERYDSFLGKYHGRKLVVLELGIGWRNQLIKTPLMRLVEREPKAVYVTINKGEIYIPENIRKKSYGLDGDLAKVLENLNNI